MPHVGCRRWRGRVALMLAATSLAVGACTAASPVQPTPAVMAERTCQFVVQPVRLGDDG